MKRRFAGLVAAGIFALALVLASPRPAHADPSDPPQWQVRNLICQMAEDMNNFEMSFTQVTELWWPQGAGVGHFWDQLWYSLFWEYMMIAEQFPDLDFEQRQEVMMFYLIGVCLSFDSPPT